mmetsp:Transcript_13729/g.42544  ORF Transcript_13729/g.42544 Transcript_13729/m.42544 type:complete len:224 (-) Transcript_13729:305-976(-)
MSGLLLLQVGRRVVGQVVRRGVGAGRRGQKAPVGRELLQVRRRWSLGARLPHQQQARSGQARGGGISSAGLREGLRPAEHPHGALGAELGPQVLQVGARRPSSPSTRKRRGDGVSYAVDATRRDSIRAGATRATSSSGATRCRPRAAARLPRGRLARPRPAPAAAKTRASSAGKRATGRETAPTRARASAAPTGAVPVDTAAARARRRAAAAAAARRCCRWCP